MNTIKHTIWEVFLAIMPIAALVIILQYTLIWLPPESVVQFLVGLSFVFAGLVLFLIGVQVGLLRVGEKIGSALPRTGKVWIVLLFSFILGFAVTVAEPDVHVLAGYVDHASDGAIAKWELILPVAVGLGVFVALSMARIVYNVSIKWLLFGGYALVLGLAYVPALTDTFIPVSFDAGGVTTGPLAVPFILAFGVGVASVLRSNDKTVDGFGLVALASIGPIIAVMLMGILYV